MKRLLTPLMILMSALWMSAGTVTVTFDIDDASRVTVAERVSSTESIPYDIHKGKNTFVLDDYTTVVITATEGSFLTGVTREVSAKNKEAKNEAVYQMNNCQLWSISSTQYENETFTIKTSKKSSLRTGSITVDVDEPSLVKLQLSITLENIDLQAGENQVKFVPDVENTLFIMANGSSRLYQVLLNGEAVAGKEDNYYWDDIVVKDGDRLEIIVHWPDTPVEVNIEIPEDAKSYITEVLVNNEAVSNWSEPDFTVNVGQIIQFRVDTENYNLESFKVNGKATEFADRWYQLVRAATTYSFDVHAWGEIPVNIDVNPAQATVYRGSTAAAQYALTLSEGLNTGVMIDEKYPYVVVRPNSGYYVESITINGTEAGDVAAVLSVPKDGTVKVNTAAIVNELRGVIYVDDIDVPELGYSFSTAIREGLSLESGYNEVTFSAFDNPFNLNMLMGDAGYVRAYQNGSRMSSDSDNLFIFDMEDGDVVKIYAGGSPSTYTLTYSVEEGVEASAIMDRIVAVGATQRVLSGTEVTVTAPGAYLTVNGTPVSAEALSEPYVLTIDGTTALAVTSSAAGLTTLTGASDDEQQVIYNLQGVAVGRDLESLPRGIYVRGGVKILR